MARIGTGYIEGSFKKTDGGRKQPARYVCIIQVQLFGPVHGKTNLFPIGQIGTVKDG